ncbi:hypothetical protein QE152_g25046 [Popillia japonica]|uniref:Transposase n=1 Tax=Popillia japonica TaxID=7064 RepID=A0AAW1K378_POPJA
MSRAVQLVLEEGYSIRVAAERMDDWLRAFLKRRTTLRIRKPVACSLSRPTSFNPHNVRIFFENLGSLLERCPNVVNPERIYNLDETGTTTVQNPKKTIATKGIKQVNHCTSGERGELVTTCAIVSAIGTYRVSHFGHFVRITRAVKLHSALLIPIVIHMSELESAYISEGNLPINSERSEDVDQQQLDEFVDVDLTDIPSVTENILEESDEDLRIQQNHTWKRKVMKICVFNKTTLGKSQLEITKYLIITLKEVFTQIMQQQ